ncbi:hypothetical protein AAJ76_460008949 [Vairimorpha ceranae]|uniref:Uncharacterized protein n=1 Tax=Vairimorpha ceranae TaxID=40302 RepID=A0A0F9WB12_9MICR|nr:hypothetical protein AAJ76_460008949 [Vairimorpha ceranae]KKO74766.1 hypothetical protein AAJ76_460008949 [Vairimorpha ceranae]
MGLFSNYYLHNRYVKALHPIQLINMSTSLLSYNNISYFFVKNKYD